MMIANKAKIACKNSKCRKRSSCAFWGRYGAQYFFGTVIKSNGCKFYSDRDGYVPSGKKLKQITDGGDRAITDLSQTTVNKRVASPEGMILSVSRRFNGLDKILGAVSDVFGVRRTDIVSRAATRDVADARKVYFTIAKVEGFTETDAAVYIQRHRSSAYASRKAFGELVSYDRKFREKVEMVCDVAGVNKRRVL